MKPGWAFVWMMVAQGAGLLAVAGLNRLLTLGPVTITMVWAVGAALASLLVAEAHATMKWNDAYDDGFRVGQQVERDAIRSGRRGFGDD